MLYLLLLIYKVLSATFGNNYSVCALATNLYVIWSMGSKKRLVMLKRFFDNFNGLMRYRQFPMPPSKIFRFWDEMKTPSTRKLQIYALVIFFIFTTFFKRFSLIFINMQI